MTHSATPAPGRRSAHTRRRRLDATLVLAVLLPLLAAGALYLVRPGPATDPVEPPTRTALTRATLVCPTATAGSDEVALTSAVDGVQGAVQVGLGADQRPADLASGEVTLLSGRPEALAVVGEDDTAPGLVAGRLDNAEPAAAGCPAPAPVAWFTGVGSGAGHTSVIELVNPDSGTAIADITVYGRSGAVEADQLHGVSVPGGTSVRLSLASIVPRRDELAVKVVAARGRVGALVLDRLDGVGSAELTQDWLPAQPEPALSNLMMGLAPGPGRRTLLIANGTDDEVRADIRVVTDRSVFAPEGLPEVRIAPNTVQRIALSSVLDQAIGDGATGLLVESTGAVTATVRSYVDGDLSHAVPGTVVDATATALLPEGGPDSDKTLELAGASRHGVVTVVSRSESGEELDRVRAEISPDRGLTVPLPADAVLVTVTVERTSVVGAAMMAGRDGAAVVPLTVAATNDLVPAVRPGLP